MDIERAKELLSALADGVDPLTGEVLDRGNVCNKPEIIRALHVVLGELEKPEFIGVEDFIFDLIGQQIEGNGAMMLTTEITQEMFNPARFVTVPLTGSLWRTELYLARLKDMVPSPAAQALYQFLLEKWSDSSQPSVVDRDE